MSGFTVWAGRQESADDSFWVMGTECNILYVTPLRCCFGNQMVVEAVHVIFGKKAATNTALIGDDKDIQPGL